MSRDGETIRDVTERWVQEMNSYPYELIEKLSQEGDIAEVTPPGNGDRVYVYDLPDGCEEHYGEIENHLADADVYLINLDDGTSVEVKADDFEVERDELLPMWGTLWSFGDSADDWWIEEDGGLQIMADCGFRIYHSDMLGYVFGIDGAGYSFYEAHWIPLYKARGLQWHDPRTETGAFYMKESRKADLYNGLLAYLSESVGSSEELVSVLKSIGFTDQEIEYEGLGVIQDEETTDATTA